jgi:hypothetical protein
MNTIHEKIDLPRYAVVPDEKAEGATYTPPPLSDFVAEKIIDVFDVFPVGRPLRIMDPAVGDGQLLISILQQLCSHPELNIEVYGFETNQQALRIAERRITRLFGHVAVHFEHRSFLDFVLEHFGMAGTWPLFSQGIPKTYDLIIANPPYVRTQIMGARQARILAGQFGLSGRVDLYFAFVVAMARVLNPHGVAGIIVSNRFMTTRSGAPVRRALLEQFDLRRIWDFGDTKLFEAAVLPAVLVAEGKNHDIHGLPDFTSIYETDQPSVVEASTPLRALSFTGVVQVQDGRKFLVQHGKLVTDGTRDGVWRMATEAGDSWLATVEAHTWRTFGDIGKIRVGVKTCADKVFIRSDWNDLPEGERPELLRPLITHHVSRRFKPLPAEHSPQILYPHEVVQGRRRAVDLSLYPCSRVYFERHRAALESREYVTAAGREWYEIWVPQDPAAWDHCKLVFRDICKEPTFWIDQGRSIVNGDCYWLICQNPDESDLLWLAAAIGNSRFIEKFYDNCFHNKLYAGRRRFITQYVEKFPLPDPNGSTSKAIVARAKEIYSLIPSAKANVLQEELERMVWKAFGLAFEKAAG